MLDLSCLIRTWSVQPSSAGWFQNLKVYCKNIGCRHSNVQDAKNYVFSRFSPTESGWLFCASLGPQKNAKTQCCLHACFWFSRDGPFAHHQKHVKTVVFHTCLSNMFKHLHLNIIFENIRTPFEASLHCTFVFWAPECMGLIFWKADKKHWFSAFQYTRCQKPCVLLRVQQ